MYHLLYLLLGLEAAASTQSGTFLSLGGQNYSNNSVVDLAGIGNSSKTGLICHTNYTNCCTGGGSDNLGSRWYYPGNRTVTSNRSRTEAFFRTRGTMFLSIYDRTNPEENPPIGIYYCEIRNRSGNIILQEIYVGVYPNNQGKPSIMSLTFDPVTGALTCVSSGGPASEFTWSRSGPQYQEHQQIVNTTTATYLNILTINSNNVSDYVGTFTCTVNNTRGRDEKSMKITEINISHQTSYSEGSAASFKCSSDLAVQSIMWFHESGKKIKANKQSLGFQIDRVTSDLNYTEYTCVIHFQLRPEYDMLSVSKSFTFIVSDAVPSKDKAGMDIVIIVVVVIFALLFVGVVLIVIFMVIWLIKKRRKYVGHEKSDVPSVNGNGVSSFIEYSSDEQEEEIQKIPEMEAVNGSLVAPVDSSANESTSAENPSKETSFIGAQHPPIPLQEFRQYITDLRAAKGKKLELQFNSLEKSSNDDFTIASNYREKNRFKNILPYNFNRVLLKTSSEESCDYINASYIKGYGRDRVYIAAQGPTEHTEEDFWRMIMDYRIPTVIMLTRVFEGKKKCQQYYPVNIDETYTPCNGSGFTVVLTKSIPYADFTIRELSVTKNEGDSHQLILYHYTAWPDHGVPSNAMSMISFIKMVRKKHPHDMVDPVLVHCSAGVGRSGTFITLDYMLERIKMEKSINIQEFVAGLRRQRMFMVQTVDQYVFIYTALLELLMCGETEIAAAGIRMAISKLRRMEPSGSITGFEKQFNVLQDVSGNVPTADFSDAQNKDNKHLNRYKDKLPYNYSRVHLREVTAEESSYINASFVGGYRRSGAYIVTQAPLPNTAKHFWKMVKEQEVKCIVMLCRLKEADKEVCHRYWPQGKGSPEEFGQFSVTITSQDIQTGYIMRKMDVAEMANESKTNKFSVIHIQYLQWSEGGVPSTTAAVLEIADLVQKIQMSTGNRPVVVMCNDGANRSGAFLGVHAQMERLKAEGVVDVFQFIKSARYHRAGLVANKEQFVFCHEALADFLDGFETYANFKQP